MRALNLKLALIVVLGLLTAATAFHAVVYLSIDPGSLSAAMASVGTSE